MRGSRALVALTLVLALIQPAHAGEGDIIANAFVNPTAKSWWANCKSVALKDNCIELIEILDDATGKWIPAIEEKNPYWKAGVDLPIRELASTQPKCGLGNTSHADYCYLFKGAAVDGSDQMLTTLVYSTEEEVGFPRIKISLVGQNGISPKRSKIPGNDNQWVVLKPETSFRLTVISESGGQRAGIAFARMKNPSLAVTKGSDGKTRIIASGSVQEVNEYYVADRSKPNPCNATDGNELTANNYLVEFSINIEPYYRQYAVLQGTPPGGIFITQNGGCASDVTIDPATRLIQVISTGTHYDIFGEVIKGWVEASIRGDMIRKVFKLEPKTMNQAIVEVTASDGTPQTATHTTKYIAASDVVEIRAYGYTFSSPKIKIKLQQNSASDATAAAEQSTSQPTSQAAQAAPATSSKKVAPKSAVKTLICKKGKVVKKVVGTKPKCPPGYRA